MSMIVAAVVGLVIAALLVMIGEWGYLQAGFAGVVGAILLGFVLTQFMCGEGTAKADLQAVREGKKGAAAATAAAATAAGAATAAASAAASSAGNAPSARVAASPTAASAGSAPSAAAPASASQASASAPAKAFEMQPSTPLAGEAELASRQGDWKYEGDGAAAKPKKAAAKKPAAKKAAPKETAAKDDKPKRAPVAADGKPETLTQARGGGADDLKMISGVGPKLEGMLNTMGFWHFDQVASWRKKEVQWVNDNLEGFKGRIERDDWVSQAKILAKGGETEFSKRKKK